MIKNPQIWCMNAQVEFCMLNHQEQYLNSKWSHFHEFWMISEIQATVGLSILWRVQWRKALSLMICALSWSGKMVKWMESEILEHESVFHLKILVWKINLAFDSARSSLIEKNVFVLSHPSSSLTLQRKMARMRLKGSKFWVNIHAWRWRVAQKSLKNWFETIL